jgi:5-(carboxyamino)imidazole ribonucleotide synthase
MTVGVVGGGQLGRMLALAGIPLGIDCLFLDPSAGAPAARVGPLLAGEFTDGRLLRELARRTEVITFDWENVSARSLRAHARGPRMAPPLAALQTGQDRVAEKRLFERLGIPTTRWSAPRTLRALERAAEGIGFPGVLKTRRFGYDGKGQVVVRERQSLEAAWQALAPAPVIYEEFVPFEFEVSIIGARSRRGEVAVYPLNGNLHRGGILRVTRAPFGGAALARSATAHLERVLEHFRYVGILAIEFFVRAGRLVANEMAPRVHNSGHWTIEGAVTSQFENHLRAILDLPLGSTDARGHAAMVNLIGRMPRRRALLGFPGLHLHDYGKAERPGRKLGHCTLVMASAAARDRATSQLLKLVNPDLRIRLPRPVHSGHG